MYSRFVSWFEALSQGIKLAVVLAALIALPVTIGLVVLLSPILRVLALAFLLLSVVVLFVKARRSRPLKSWGLTFGASLVLFLVFNSVSAALYGGSSEDQQASASKPASQTQESSSQGQESSAHQQGGSYLEQTTVIDEPETKEPKEPTQQDASNEQRSKVEAAYQVSDEQTPEQGVQKKEAAKPTARNTGTGVARAPHARQPVASKPLSYEQRVRQAIAKRKYSGDKIAGVYVQTDQTGCKRIYVRHQAGAN
jgi:hypothetical protein